LLQKWPIFDLARSRQANNGKWASLVLKISV
jgi:hypothetical protein